jgi:hypothetical protein
MSRKSHSAVVYIGVFESQAVIVKRPNQVCNRCLYVSYQIVIQQDIVCIQMVIILINFGRTDVNTAQLISRNIWGTEAAEYAHQCLASL